MSRFSPFITAGLLLGLVGCEATATAFDRNPLQSKATPPQGYEVAQAGGAQVIYDASGRAYAVRPVTAAPRAYPPATAYNPQYAPQRAPAPQTRPNAQYYYPQNIPAQTAPQPAPIARPAPNLTYAPAPAPEIIYEQAAPQVIYEQPAAQPTEQVYYAPEPTPAPAYAAPEPARAYSPAQPSYARPLDAGANASTPIPRPRPAPTETQLAVRAGPSISSAGAGHTGRTYQRNEVAGMNQIDAQAFKLHAEPDAPVPPRIEYNIPHLPQEEPLWCWAAAAQQAVGWVNDGQAPAQCAIVAMAHGMTAEECCGDREGVCARTGEIPDIIKIIQRYGGKGYEIGVPSGPRAIYEQLQLGRTMLIRLRPDRDEDSVGIRHIIVVRGVEWLRLPNGKLTATLLYNDPLGGNQRAINYEEIADFFEQAMLLSR